MDEDIEAQLVHLFEALRDSGQEFKLYELDLPAWMTDPRTSVRTFADAGVMTLSRGVRLEIPPTHVDGYMLHVHLTVQTRHER